MSYLPAAADMSTTDVVGVLQDPGGGLHPDKPMSVLVPLAVVGALIVGVGMFGKKSRR